MNLEGFRLSPHALQRIRREGILWEEVVAVLRDPQEVMPGHRGAHVPQVRTKLPDGRWHWVRAVIDYDDEPPAVLTVYETTNPGRYRGRT
jgi:hypothetical protein